VLRLQAPRQGNSGKVPDTAKLPRRRENLVRVAVADRASPDTPTVIASAREATAELALEEAKGGARRDDSPLAGRDPGLSPTDG